jgi:hypothetical protein
MEFGVDVHHALDEIVAGRELREALKGRSHVRPINDPELARLQPFHIPPEEGNAGPSDLKAGFPAIRVGDHDEDPSRDRAFVRGSRIGHSEPR